MSDRSPEVVLWDLMRGALAARALALVAELGVAEALAAGPRAVEELAREVGAEPDTLHRLLRALASDGVFAEVGSHMYGNTETSELLRQPSERAFAHLFGSVFHRAAGELDATGEPSFSRTFGTDYWSWLAQHANERAVFDTAMGGTEASRAARVARFESVEWRGDETVVDVGGGNGSFLIELLRQQPSLRGIVFDLPETVRDETAFADRLTFVGGSFFDNVPAGDVYVLATILHDWEDERATAILRTIRAAAPPEARLFIIESVIQPGNDPDGAKWLDLLMLALFGGRERDEAQWRELLDSGGFEPVSIEDGFIEARCR
jgi:O-methyltransferase domain/Dimerisation domain